MKEKDVEIIGNLKAGGLTAEEIGQRLKLSVNVVGEAFNIIKSQPVRAGYFERQIEKKKEHNNDLKNIENTLAISVSAGWKMVELLEFKKRYLSKIIEDMERYIKKGSNVSDLFIKSGIKIDD